MSVNACSPSTDPQQLGNRAGRRRAACARRGRELPATGWPGGSPEVSAGKEQRRPRRRDGAVSGKGRTGKQGRSGGLGREVGGDGEKLRQGPGEDREGRALPGSGGM